MDIQKLALPAGIAAILVLAFAYLGGTIQLGAHPFWSVQVAYIGIGVGLVVLIAAHKFWGSPNRTRLYCLALD